MPKIQVIPPEVLKNRHLLTSCQISHVFGYNIFPENFDEKVAVLDFVKEFLLLADAFNNAGVGFIPLKGPVLSYRLYGDSVSRHYSDLDILVNSRSVPAAIEVLTSLNYKAYCPEWPSKYQLQKILLKNSDSVTLINPVKSISVELHWRLLRASVVSFSRLEEIINNNLSQIKFGGRTFKVLSDELELLYLIIHGGHHWWRRLKWLTDITVFLKTKSPDWGHFYSLVKELKARRMVALCNAMLSEYFPEDPLIPSTFKEKKFMVRFSQRMIKSQEELTSDFFKRIFQSVCFELISFPSYRYKLRTIKNYLFVKEFFGGSTLFNSIPLFYVYGPIKLTLKRLFD